MEQVIATLCRTLDRDRFESAVLCLRDGGPLADELRAEGFTVFSINTDLSKAEDFLFCKVFNLFIGDLWSSNLFRIKNNKVPFILKEAKETSQR